MIELELLIVLTVILVVSLNCIHWIQSVRVLAEIRVVLKFLLSWIIFDNYFCCYCLFPFFNFPLFDI